MKEIITYFLVISSTISLILLGIYSGNLDYSFQDISKILIIPNDDIISTIVWDIRIPRILVSIVVGSSLGLAGVLIQLSTKSPLGDPNLFGIGGGATIFLSSTYIGLFSLGTFNTFLGCLITSILVALLLSKLISRPNLTPIKLAIMGIAVAALTASIGISVASYGKIFPTQIINLLTGSFTTSNWNTFYFSFFTFLICMILSLILSRKFYPMILSDILSKSLGVKPLLIRNFSMVIVGTLSGLAIYGGGLIGFIGLVSPHIARKLFPTSPHKIIINSILIGGLITLAADQITRFLFMPIELPVSLTTTLIGAPLMMYLGFKMK